MARRRRRRHGYQVTLDVLNAALAIHWWENHFGGEEEGRRAWSVLRTQIEMAAGHRPAPFWAYEPDVPEDLRAMADLDPSPEVKRKAVRWLLGEGQDHLRSGETEAIRRELARAP